MTTVPESTPVLVGVGQSSERIDTRHYAGHSAADLAGRAASDALADTGAEPSTVAAAIDTVAAIRQFETSQPGAAAPLGRADNFPRAVARRVGADPTHAVLEVGGGQGPQHLVNEMAAAIARGEREVVLLVGSEAISTTRHLAASEEKPDFSETVPGTLEDRGYGLRGLVSLHAANHGLVDAPSQYALFENARRARLKLSREDYATEMGRLFAPFTTVAADNPHAAAPTRRSAEELVTPSERNRMIADPYPRFVVARDQVNQGAAVLLMSVAAARRLGVPEDRWVFLHGHADLRERDLLDREDLSRSPAAVMAAEHALEVAGATVDEVDSFDLYSCFPIAVSNVADGLGLAEDDPRGLTLTGGLPFFGGAGNNYSMHAIAETVQRCRQHPDELGFVGANGGLLSKYSVGIYATTPTPWRPDRSDELQAEIAAWPAVPTTAAPEGWAVVETYTVKHGRAGRRTAIVVGRLEGTGERFIAMGLEDNEEVLELLSGTEQPIGQRVYARTFATGSRVTTTRERMDDLRPRPVPRLRETYEHILVRRDGHLLEVTINRPQARNSLHPPAHEELAEVFDAYEADPDLWVALITGAGTEAFCAGNDLIYTASGKPMYMPLSGFAGLTSRGLRKPVIAAVNGFAMGGGLETALACHLVVADETAQLALSEVKVGLVAGAGGVVRLPRQLPSKIATEMILTGRRMGAAEAEQRGLVNRVAPAGKAVETARELAKEILAASPTSVRISLEVMAETAGIPDALQAVIHPTTAFDELMTSADMHEGLSAFASKRAPQWTNR